jgi:hypothetical protein
LLWADTWFVERHLCPYLPGSPTDGLYNEGSSDIARISRGRVARISRGACIAGISRGACIAGISRGACVACISFGTSVVFDDDERVLAAASSRKSADAQQGTGGDAGEMCMLHFRLRQISKKKNSRCARRTRRFARRNEQCP